MKDSEAHNGEQQQRFYEFGPFRLDALKGLLLRDGTPVPLPRKAFVTLLILAQNSGQVVSKDELMRRIWPDTIVEENNLTQRISQLRRALGENTKDHEYIVTAPGHGYCFVARVKKISEETSETLAVVESNIVVLEKGGRESGTEGVTGWDGVKSNVAINEKQGGEFSAAVERWVPIAISSHRFVTGSHLKTLVLFFALSGLIVLPGYLWIESRYNKAIPRETTEGRSHSLAVLPFKSLNSETADNHLGPGIADALITKLSNIREISVRPTRGVLKYEGTQSPLTAGRELKVDSVLDGTVQKVGDRVRVSVQLLSVKDGKPLWARIFDAEFTDIFAIQDSISEQVVSALMIELTDETHGSLTKHHTDSTEAYQAYLRGRHFWNKRTKEGLNKAVDYFQQAVAADPKYALAYAGMADSYGLMFVYHSNVMPAEEAGRRATQAASRAVQLDDKLAEGHTSLAACFQIIGNTAGAEREFRQALVLNPSYATAHQWLGELLRSLGRFDEALEELKRAQEIDPLSPIINSSLGTSFYFARQYDQMAEQNRKALELDPNFAPAHLGLGLALEQRGLYEEAISEFEKAKKLSSQSEFMIASLAHAYAVAGNRGKAERTFAELKQLEKLRPVSSCQLALFYAGSGKRDQAFVWLQKAQQEQIDFPMLKADPRLDDLRADPKFQALLKSEDL